MTPCEEKGYKIGDRFKVIEKRSFDPGSIIELYKDDKTDGPLFKLIEGNTRFFCADGDPGAYISLNNIQPINKDDGMTIKSGNKVKFAGCAKHLKSYDKDAVGEVLERTKFVMPSISSNVKVRFTYPDGRKLTLPAVSKKNLIRFRGTQYEEVKRNEADSEGWIKWEGGECPVERGMLVDVRLMNLEVEMHKSDDCDWSKTGAYDDIIAYRLNKPADSDDNNAKQDNKEMTTLHDWVHELGSINERAIELRELITKEVQKCGGSVEWSVKRQDTPEKPASHNDPLLLSVGGSITWNATDWTDLTKGDVYTVHRISDDEFYINDDEGDERHIEPEDRRDWYAVTCDK